jgi:hypothetical protein
MMAAMIRIVVSIGEPILTAGPLSCCHTMGGLACMFPGMSGAHGRTFAGRQRSRSGKPRMDCRVAGSRTGGGLAPRGSPSLPGLSRRILPP